jgi:hypothetical protein
MCCAIEHAFNDPVYCINQHALKSARPLANYYAGRFTNDFSAL